MSITPSISYRDTGKGEALLMLHGGFSNGRATWHVQARSLVEKHRMLILDRRGHGNSPQEPQPYTIEGDAADALDVADRAGAPRFHLLGLSYGGLVAIEIAAAAPERVLSLHLIEPPFLALLPDDPDVRALDRRVGEIRARGRERGPEWIAERFFDAIAGPEGLREVRSSRAWPLIVREAGRILDEEYAGDYPVEALDRLNRAMLSSTARPVAKQGAPLEDTNLTVPQAPTPDDVRASVAPTSRSGDGDPLVAQTFLCAEGQTPTTPPCFPVHIYTGGRSSPALQKVAARLVELIEGARLVEIRDAGHGVQFAGEPFDRELLAVTGLESHTNWHDL